MYISTLGTKSERVPGKTEGSARASSNPNYNLNLCVTKGQVDNTEDQGRPSFARTWREGLSSNLTSKQA